MKLFLGTTLATLLMLSINARATLIVDTGPEPTNAFGGLLLDQSQRLAAEFTTTQDWVIDAIFGWMSQAGPGETGTIALYTDGGSTPGSELFSNEFTGSDTDPSWQGASGLDWALSAGTYWVSFEVRSLQSLISTMPNPAVSPLASYAFELDGTIPAGWLSSPLDFGVQIDARTPAVAPSPATAALLGLAILLLRARRR